LKEFAQHVISMRVNGVTFRRDRLLPPLTHRPMGPFRFGIVPEVEVQSRPLLQHAIQAIEDMAQNCLP
jgi:hypothetical protein